MADVVEHALYEAGEYAWIKQQVAALDAGDLHSSTVSTLPPI